MKMLKKLICLALALTMLLTACAFAEDDETLCFDLELTQIGERTTEEWYSSYTYRAVYTDLIYLDYFLATEDMDQFDPEGFASTNSYVGISDGLLVTYCHLTDKDLVIVCDPTAGFASYSYYEVADDSIVEAFMDSICSGKYALNDNFYIGANLDALKMTIAFAF